MESYNTADIIRILKEKQISLFSLADFERLFRIRKQQTLYKKIQRLEENKLIKKIIKGKYLYALNKPNNFLIANYTCQPSYISLESALSFYGIMTGFSYKIFSVTFKKSRQFTIDQLDYQYSQIDHSLFWGYEKKEDFLIAEPEKALLDYLYFSTKGLRHIDWEEMELNKLNKKKIIAYAKQYHNTKLLTILKQHI